jgi:hypothetical protein
MVYNLRERKGQRGEEGMGEKQTWCARTRAFEERRHPGCNGEAGECEGTRKCKQTATRTSLGIWRDFQDNV